MIKVKKGLKKVCVITGSDYSEYYSVIPWDEKEKCFWLENLPSFDSLDEARDWTVNNGWKVIEG